MMEISELDIPQTYKEKLSGMGYRTLYPPQEDAIGAGLLSGKNLVLAVPTASGKTLIALLAIIKAASEGRKALYIVPLKALAEEKFSEMTMLGLDVILTTGDYDVTDERIARHDVVIATCERVDSLLRHSPAFFADFSLVVADEVHLLDSPRRGPTLEVVLTKLKGKQMLALSATIANARDIAEWLNAGCITSEWRPVPLRKGVFYDGEIFFPDGEKEIENGDPCVSLAYDTIREGGQALIFVNTRKSSQALARRIASFFSEKKFNFTPLRFSEGIYKEELEFLSRFSVAFHHAGLSGEDRHIIEDNFKSAQIKALVATPTLAAGVNLPARRVIVRDVRRFERGRSSYIPNLEVQQMLGRAGRPQYDSHGEALLVASSEKEKDNLFDNYINAPIEDITSKLAIEGVLRSHVLSLIASRLVSNEEELHAFFRKTFYARQFDIDDVLQNVEKVLIFLEENELVSEFEPTPFGERISQLYIDPESGIILKSALREKMSCIGILHAVCATPDVEGFYLRRGDYETYDAYAQERRGEFLLDVPDYFYEPEKYEIFLSSLKTACILEEWISEIPENDICSRHDIGPGDLYRLRESANWLLYSFSEVARLFKAKRRGIEDVRRRVMYGVSAELLSLVSVRNVGRVRARRLFSFGIKNLEQLREADSALLSRILGEKIAASIMEELAEGKRGKKGRMKIDEEEEGLTEKGEAPPKEGQTRLEDF